AEQHLLQLLRRAEVELVADDRKLDITVSVGLASFRRDGDTLAELLTCADAALYEAKRGGRNRLVSSNGRAQGIFFIGGQVEEALKTGRVRPVYQPIVDLSSGAVVAESPLGTAPLGRHFPRRNRVIAGLVLGLVVIEAAARSGSLLTARLANEAGRELFGVPGSPLDPRSKGANDLIRQGAHLTESAEDVFANLPDHPARQGLTRDPMFQHGLPGFAEAAPAWTAPQESAAEIARARLKIPPMIGPEPVAVDEIARRCQLSSAAVLAVILELELGGQMETLAGNRVVRHADP
ncbi:MAG: hypothetical protein B7X08_06775, partial [Acidocella sp. 20-63-7]